jgi:hypothetical protein
MKTLLAAAVSAVLLASGTVPAFAQTVGNSAPHKPTPMLQTVQEKGKSADSKGKAETKGTSAEKGKPAAPGKSDVKGKSEEKGKK